MVPAELFRGSSGRTAKSRAVTRARRNFSAFLELTGRLTTNSVLRDRCHGPLQQRHPDDGRSFPASRRRRGTPAVVPTVAEQLKGSHAHLVATHHLAVDQAGTHLEVVHRLDHQRKAGGPVVALAGDQPDATGSRRTMSLIAVMLDLGIQLEPDGSLSAGDGRQGSMKRARSADRRLRIRSINMPHI